MNQLIAQVVACLLISSAVHAREAQHDCPSMQVTIAAAKNAERAKAPLLTFSDFTDASVSLTEGQIVLNIGLTPEASKRWVEFTSKNVGRSVEFIVNHRVVKRARIADPNLGKGLLLGPFDEQEGEQLAAAINHADPRCRSATVG